MPIEIDFNIFIAQALQSVMSIQQLAWRHFTKKHGLSLRPDVLSFLEERLSGVADSQKASLVEYVAAAYAKQPTSDVVDRDRLEDIIRQLLRSHQMVATVSGQLDPRQYLRVASTNDPPVLRIDPLASTALFAYEQQGPAFSSTDDFVNRYHLLRERLQRLCDLSDLTGIKSARTRAAASATPQSFTLFGLLGRGVDRQAEGVFLLEDPDDHIALNTSSMASPDLILTEGCFAIVRGVLQPSTPTAILAVQQITMPPLEARAASLRLPGMPCPLRWVAGETEAAGTLAGLLQERCPDVFALCLSELWLNRPEQLEAFDRILQRYEAASMIPSLIILLGRFHSHPPRPADPNGLVRVYQPLFDGLARVVARHPKVVAGSLLIIVPADDDPLGTPGLLPRPPLPPSVFAGLSEAGIAFHSVSNPCRLFWFDREIVLLRDELSRKFFRASSLQRGGSFAQVRPLAIEALLRQANLQPFLSAVQPSLPRGRCAFGLIPLPDLLLVAENIQQTGVDEALVEGTVTGNPGSFSGSGSFLAFYPASRRLEHCQVSPSPFSPQPPLAADGNPPDY